MSSAPRLHKAFGVLNECLALGNERFNVDGATFVRNRRLPSIRDANHVTDIRVGTQTEIDKLMCRIDEEFAGFPYRRFDLDNEVPQTFESHLRSEGYQRGKGLVMMLDGKLTGQARKYEIREVGSGEDWQAFAATDFGEYPNLAGSEHVRAFSTQMGLAREMKAPPCQWWAAYVDGAPRSFVMSWAGTDGYGIIDDLFTHPDFRRKGLATSLIHHCVAICRLQGARSVVIYADAEDTPKDMYAVLGFKTVAERPVYFKGL